VSLACLNGHPVADRLGGTQVSPGTLFRAQLVWKRHFRSHVAGKDIFGRQLSSRFNKAFVAAKFPDQHDEIVGSRRQFRFAGDPQRLEGLFNCLLSKEDARVVDADVQEGGGLC
jgi:hypothetical protein